MFHRFTCVDLNFWGCVGWVWLLFLFGLCLFFVWLLCLVCFPHEWDLWYLLSCVRIVCNLERPSELSWRARHGRKKKEEDISPDLVLSLAAVAARGWGGHQEQPVDHNAPEADRRNVPDDVISVSDGELDQESSLGEESSYACDSSASEGKESSDSGACNVRSEWSILHARACLPIGSECL